MDFLAVLLSIMKGRELQLQPLAIAVISLS